MGYIEVSTVYAGLTIPVYSEYSIPPWKERKLIETPEKFV